MQPFLRFSAVAVPIDIPNCDTDQIIPARFLRRAKDDPAYARFLLHDLRFHANDTETDFIFNQIAYSDAQILVCDINWGLWFITRGCRQCIDGQSHPCSNRTNFW